MRFYEMLEKFSDRADHPVQTVDKCLVGDQTGEPIKQVLLGEGVDVLDPRVTLFAADEEKNCQNFFIGEYGFRIIAVSLLSLVSLMNTEIVKTKVNIRLKQKSILRQRRRSQAKAKARRRNKKKQVRDIPKAPSYIQTYMKPFKVASLSPDFRIIDNTDTVLMELHNIITCRGKQQKTTKLHIDLTKVTKFDIGSLTCLLSTLRFTENYQGNVPVDKTCKEYFETSGFLTWMRDITGRKFSANTSNNLIFEKGVDKTSNAMVGMEIKKAIKYLTQKESTFPPVYSII